MMKKLLLSLLLAIAPASAFAQCSGVFTSNTVCGTVAGGLLGPVPFSTVSGGGASLVVGTTVITGGTSNGVIFNNAGVVGNTASANGALLNTNSSGVPAFTITPLLGVPGTSTGTLRFGGITSGTVTVTPQSVAGTPTLTLPNASGTFAASATSPIVIDAATGNASCASCVTSSGGGAITGTAPIAVSAAGVVSITGAAGQVLNGSPAAFTATPTLGVAGASNGSLTLTNTTSGSIAINTVAGALGSQTISLPAASGTFAVSATAPITLSATGAIGLTTPLAMNFGGSAANLTASNGGLVYSNASSLAILAGTATANQIPLSGSSSAPSWSTATYPATAAAGTVLVAGSSNVISASATPALGANGGTGGTLTLNGATSGSATIKVNTVAGASTNFQLPASNGVSGQLLQTDGSGNTAWATAAAGGTVTNITQGGLTTLSTSPCTTTCTIGTNATITPQGRLTLTSGTPVLATSVTASGNLYYTPYAGNLASLFDGTNMIPVAFSELTVALGSNWTSSTTYDWYLGLDGSNLRLCSGAAWTNSTTRSESHTRVNGLLLNTASMTCRYNNTTTFTCAAQRCTFVGTARTTGAGQIDFIFGAAGSGGVASVLNVWNEFNRVNVGSTVTDNSTTHTYSSATIREWGSSTTMQVSFLTGYTEDSFVAQTNGQGSTLAVNNATLAFGVGYDSTTTFCGQNFLIFNFAAAAQLQGGGVNCVKTDIGSHIFSMNEKSDGTNLNNFNNASVANIAFTGRM